MTTRDNGFLKLDNSIIDYWMSRLNHSEFKTLLAIYRKTVGWNKDYDRISQSQLAALTGLTTRSIGTAITSLEKLGIVITAGKDKTAKVFSLNLSKLYSVCLKSAEILEMESKLETISESCEDIENDAVNNSYDNNINFVHNRHYEDTNKKQIKDLSVSNEVNIPFEVFWELYDYNKGKQSEIKAKWESMSDEERQLTINILPAYKDSTKDKTYRKYPMSFLNSEAWNDEITVTKDTHTDNQYNASNSNNNSYNAKSIYNTNNNYSAAYKDFNDVDSIVSNKHLNDVVTKSSKIHWSELKAKGLLKSPVNTNAVVPNTDTDKMINDFLARNSSKRFCRDIA